MESGQALQASLLRSSDLNFAPKRNMLLRLIRAAQPITRTDIADRLKIDKSTVTEVVRPLIDRGILREDVLEQGGPGPRHRAVENELPIHRVNPLGGARRPLWTGGKALSNRAV